MTNSTSMGDVLNRRSVLVSLVVGLALVICGCGSSGGDDNSSDLAPDAASDIATEMPGETREGYPDGPYGTSEGDTLADLGLLTTSGEPYNLASIYQDAGNQLLLISTAAGWCTACIEEQPKLQSLHEQYGDDGLFVLVAVFEDGNFEPADAALAADWKDRYDLSFSVVADPDFAFEEYYDASLTPMNMIVDVTSMEILYLRTGFDETTVQAILQSRL